MNRTRSSRGRAITLAVICTVALGAAAGYLLHSRARQEQIRHDAHGVARTTVADVIRGRHIVFRSTTLAGGYGMVAMVSAGDPKGPRAFTSTECDRVFATTRDVVCLSSRPGVVTTYAAHVLSPGMRVIASLPLAGIPSRARISPDGRWVSTTTFVAGDSYAGTSFSTRTVISEVGRPGSGRDLESFALVHDGHTIAPVDRNFWGVTFAANDDTFYATAAWSGHTWLVRGSISRGTVTTLIEDAECPSLSPDGTHIVFKRRGSLPPGRWRLVDYDVASGSITPLAERRSVDDQVAWLDDSRVMYGLPRSGSQASVDDVWTVPADGTGSPQLLIPQAWSPALVA